MNLPCAKAKSTSHLLPKAPVPGNLSTNLVLDALLSEAVLRFIGKLLIDRSTVAHHLGDSLAVLHEAPEVFALQFAERGLGLASVVPHAAVSVRRTEIRARAELLMSIPPFFPTKKRVR